jgi:hypothetical protein
MVGIHMARKSEGTLDDRREVYRTDPPLIRPHQSAYPWSCRATRRQSPCLASRDRRPPAVPLFGFSERAAERCLL